MEINGTIFVQIFILMSLLLWLSPALFAPILRLFDERENRIEGARTKSVQMMAQASEKAKEFDFKYQKAKDEARQALQEVKAAADLERIAFLDEAKNEAKKKLEEAKKSIEQQENIVRAELLKNSENISTDIVNALLGRTI